MAMMSAKHDPPSPRRAKRKRIDTTTDEEDGEEEDVVLVEKSPSKVMRTRAKKVEEEVKQQAVAGPSKEKNAKKVRVSNPIAEATGEKTDDRMKEERLMRIRIDLVCARDLLRRQQAAVAELERLEMEAMEM
jgi:hypothetical protein